MFKIQTTGVSAGPDCSVPVLQQVSPKERVTFQNCKKKNTCKKEIIPNCHHQLWLFISLQTEMKTLKRRVTNFFSQCDKLVQFSSPDVQREVQCNIPVTPSVSPTFSTNLIHKCLGCSFNGAKEPHSDKGLTLETTALRWTCSSQSWFARSWKSLSFKNHWKVYEFRDRVNLTQRTPSYFGGIVSFSDISHHKSWPSGESGQRNWSVRTSDQRCNANMHAHAHNSWN